MNSENTPNLSDFFQVIWSRKWIVLGLMLMVFIVTMFFTLRSVPVYKAAATIMIDTSKMEMSGFGYGVKRSCILGVSHSAQKLFQRCSSAPRLGYDICGFIEMEEGENGKENTYSLLVLGHVEALEEIIDRYSIEQLFTLNWTVGGDKYDNIVEICEKKGVGLKYISPVTDRLFKRINVDDITGIPLVVKTRTPLRVFNSLIISIFDKIAAGILVLVSLPLFAAVAIGIKLDSHGPTFFLQKRFTRGLKEFYLYKFRTMGRDAAENKWRLNSLNDVEGPMFKIRKDPRITRLGAFLRRFSVDELPQLLNVLKGEMSLVGPRPPLENEVVEYKTWELQRLKVQQGMTGLWQVSGRSDLSFEEMVLLDLYYIENRHFLFNLEILFATIPSILFGEGAY